MNGPGFYGQYKGVSGQTDMAEYVSLRDQRMMTIAIPDIDFQRSIAHILGTLDDKIELNRRTNQTLESIARALFKSWFIDFDPVHAKAAGDPVANLDPATAALFPDTFEDSELGKIPAGWEVHEIGDLVDCVGGGTPSTKNPKYWEGATHHWTTPKDLSSIEAPVLTDTARRLSDAGLAKVSSGLLPVGTVLLSSRAPVGYLAIAAVPVAINQGYIALKPTPEAPTAFLLNWCFQNLDAIKARATGTTFAEISKKAFRPMPCVVPPPPLAAGFAAVAEPLYDKITANIHQSRTLAILRDALLPELLTGKLKPQGNA